MESKTSIPLNNQVVKLQAFTREGEVSSLVYLRLTAEKQVQVLDGNEWITLQNVEVRTLNYGE